MQKLKVNTSKSYEIEIGAGLLSAPDETFAEKIQNRTAMVVSDDNVFPIYGPKLRDFLAENGCKAEEFVFPHGERSKEIYTYKSLVEAMCRASLTRSDVVIALGGGVVGDLAGFAAATFQRGIDFIQLPTTLLAAVDSSVGGKNGLDLENGKNQIGAFYQPSHVICDTDTLKTLPENEYRNGCAEIIKYAMIGSEQLFQSIRETPVCNQYEAVIGKCVSMKKEFVEQDEFDRGMRMLLNFGHTVGHAVESCSRYEISHGIAVAIGMAIISKAAAVFGFCGNEVYDRLLELLLLYGLPVETDYPAELLASAMTKDKKSRGDKITLVIPEKIGKCVAHEISKEEIPMWLKAGGVR